MRILARATIALGVTLCHAAPGTAQTTANLAVLKGLSPLTVLGQSQSGKRVGFELRGHRRHPDRRIRQPTLLPFAEQQQQALRDAFITDGNLSSWPMVSAPRWAAPMWPGPTTGIAAITPTCHRPWQT